MRKLLFYARLAAQNLRKNSIFYGPNLLACSLCTALLYIVRFLTYSDMVRPLTKSSTDFSNGKKQEKGKATSNK